MTGFIDIVKAALIDPVKRKQPEITKRLNIRLGEGGDTADQTLNKMPGGWLVDLAAYPETRPIIEEWIALANDKAFNARGIDDAEAERWYSVSSQLAAICAYTNRALRAREAEAAGEAPPIHQPLLLRAIQQASLKKKIHRNYSFAPDSSLILSQVEFRLLIDITPSMTKTIATTPQTGAPNLQRSSAAGGTAFGS